MKTAQQWLSEYAVSHQNKTNITIHFICVPAIFFSIVGLLYAVPLFSAGNSMVTLAHIVALAAVIYYFLLSIRLGFVLMLFTAACLLFWRYCAINDYPIVIMALTVFVIAWTGQFIGHRIEGKKPSFFKDLQFLLIGPLWTFSHLVKP
jgi:uncharacterized membrane protein YGL010W